MEPRCCYPKDRVYPAAGGEFCLEMLRAQLPQYKPLPEDDSCDMELTMACAGNISVMVPSSGNRGTQEESFRYGFQGGQSEQLHLKDQSSRAPLGSMFANSTVSSVSRERSIQADQVVREGTHNMMPASQGGGQNESRRQPYQFDELAFEGGRENGRREWEHGRENAWGRVASSNYGRDRAGIGRDRAGIGSRDAQEVGVGSRPDELQFGNRENERYQMGSRENEHFQIGNRDNERHQIRSRENERYQIGNGENEQIQIGNRKNERIQIGNRENERIQIGNRENERIQTRSQGNEEFRIANQGNEEFRIANQEQEHVRIRNQENDSRLGNRENERVKTGNQENRFSTKGNREKEWHGMKSAQENPRGHSNTQSFGFTPSTMKGIGPYPSGHVGRVNTKLNFSELDSSVLSMSSDQHCVLASDKGESHKPLAGFDVSSDLEAKAMMLMEAKQNSENEFMMTEFEVPKKPSQQLTNRKVLGVLDDDVTNRPPVLFPDSQSSVYDSMATADESSFVPFQDESCVSFRKASEVKSSRSFGGNIGKEDSMASRSYGGKVASSASISKSIGGVAQQPAQGNRKVLQEIPVSSDVPPQQRSGYNMAQDSFSVYDSMAAADESSFVPFQDESCISFRKTSEVKSSRSFGGNIGKEDSMASRSYGGKVAPLSKPIGGMTQQPALGNRKVLQELPAMSSQPHMPEYDVPQNSYRPYNSTTMDESTFVPYCNASNASVAGTDQGAPPPAPPPSFSSVAPGRSNFPQSGTGGMSVPMPDEFLEMTQGFTQFDIKHPVSYDSASTPAHQKSVHSMSINLSIISSDGKEAATGDGGHCLAAKPCLSTITEESSGKSKLTISSNRSRNTTIATSSSSTTSLGSSGTDCDSSAMLVDPFVPETVNRMLNRLGGVPVEFVEEMAPEESFSITEGDSLRLGGTGVVYDRMALMRSSSSGGDPHSVVYRCTSGRDQENIMQVLIHGGEWAVTAAHHCQNRLVQMNLSHMAEAFPVYEQICLYKNPSNVAVTVARCHRLGSLLDFQERAYQRRVIMPDLFVTYVCASMLDAVSTLHKVGFLHTQVSPRHFLIHDISDPNFTKLPCAVRLIDFKHCVDTTQFGEDRLFVGCPVTDRDPSAAWLCPLMWKGKQWKWQVDYYGLAISMLTFITSNKEPHLLIDGQTGRYYTPKLPALFNTSLWHNVFDQLLNAEGWVDLNELKILLLRTINTKMNSMVTFLARKLQS